MHPQVRKYRNISSRDVKACMGSFIIIIIIIIFSNNEIILVGVKL